MNVKMPWLKVRLREVSKTPTGLARVLKVAPPRVYEMIGGRRAIQPDEVGPTAQFLDWTVEDLLGRLPVEARNVPHAQNNISHDDLSQLGRPPKGMVAVAVVYVSERWLDALAAQKPVKAKKKRAA